LPVKPDPERRRRLLQLGAGAVFLVLALVLVLIVVSTSGSDGAGDTKIGGAKEVNRLLEGIDQEGLVLGNPKAKVELIEFGDLQCPVCKGYSEEVLPPVIESSIRAGNVKLAFRNFTIIGDQSVDAGAAALAAGEQRRGWNYVELFYRNQGEENSGYADAAFLEAVAKAAGVEDVPEWNRDRKHLIAEVEKTTAEAQRLGFEGTPSFAIQGPNTKGLEPLGTPGSTEAFEEAIEGAN
jgi:protein-disulfide isomerase